jgi:hypothetical protein
MSLVAVGVQLRFSVAPAQHPRPSWTVCSVVLVLAPTALIQLTELSRFDAIKLLNFSVRVSLALTPLSRAA